MNSETGFLHLNAENQWPSFARHDVTIAPDGSLSLAQASGAFALRGVFRGGPFEVPDGKTPWFRLRVDAAPLPDGAHIQFFYTFTTNADSDPAYYPATDRPFTFDNTPWREALRGEFDILFSRSTAERLWIGGVLRSQGKYSPILHQMRVDYGRDTALKYLPAIYGDSEQGDLLERFLSLPESILGELKKTIDDLPLLFDPGSAPAGDFPTWLSWLAGWLAFDLEEDWSEAQTRQYLAEAFLLYGRRGTVEGLRRYLKMYAGVEAHIEEPGLDTALWSLGESLLGFTTQLAPAQAQGAVLGTSATLDQSHLTRGDDFGAALFEDLAHRFRVQIYCAELTRPGALEDARAVIEREKPAHTDYHLCVIEPRMRVGAQARIGIDTIIAQGPPQARTGMVLGLGTLAAEAEACE